MSPTQLEVAPATVRLAHQVVRQEVARSARESEHEQVRPVVARRQKVGARGAHQNCQVAQAQAPRRPAARRT